MGRSRINSEATIHFIGTYIRKNPLTKNSCQRLPHKRYSLFYALFPHLPHPLGNVAAGVQDAPDVDVLGSLRSLHVDT